ncbi:tetratricopeptide repeat protein [Alkalihalobacillus trypoxylicola]|uniref:tetratricopeptide repeat protein n=1 Tax=Alkalihalobacillus trypoxylicola TaxID=519424 RepID=UPI00129009CC|nr:hypothetical protein [Alkalihalobacillus trypoxylicola]
MQSNEGKLTRKTWESAIDEQIKYVEHSLDNLEAKIKLSILYRVSGNYSEFSKLFSNILLEEKEYLKDDKLGYRKLVLYDNGQSRIEFYKKLQHTERVIITFDSIFMTWDNPSFAFKLLSEQNMDIIAIRKKEKSTYQQDLSQEEFIEVVSPLMQGYTDKMAYGFSLGAYNTLYYASMLDCRIMAMSPRLSIHPEYGRTKIIPKFKMLDNELLPKNPKIKPIIVYDPKNSLDKRYVKEGILPSFPNATEVKIPYVGHGLAPQLLKMGLLKSFVYDFLQNKTPVYDRAKKIKSNTYYTNLGNACYQRNKLNWALNLVNKSIELESKSKEATKLKIKILKKQTRIKDACSFAKEAIHRIPNNLDLRLYLVDIFIELGEYLKADDEIKRCIHKFGENYSIRKRIKNLKDLV